MRPEEGIEIVRKIVAEWSKVYISQVFYIDKFSNIYIYEVEFSKPLASKPIPEGTVKVIFHVIEKADGGYVIEFKFENESLSHKLDQTMRTNMFEKWIDRILENKLKIKSQLHLGTEFEYTRTVDEKNKVVDPFVPKFDIMKVTDLNREIRKSQKINVESPRFISTLRTALVEMFEEADKDKSGYLSYEEFYEAFKTLSYGLSDNDILTLVSQADENSDGKISWSEFIEIGIDSIKTFFSRNKALQRARQAEREIDREALKLVYWDEIQKCNEILQKRFKIIDKEKTGKISVTDFRKVLSTNNMLTFKEINVLIRNFRNEDAFAYEEFPERLYDVRFELAKSRLMDTSLDKVSEHLVELLKDYDTENTGKIHLLKIQEALGKSKKLTLTPFQIQSLVGMSKPDSKQMVTYKQFALAASTLIEEFFSTKAICEKVQLIQNGVFKEKEDLAYIPLTPLELFKIFKKYDRDYNGFLELEEYIDCLRESDFGLTEAEIITVGLSADINGDGRIDYEEFMKHFSSILKNARFQSTLQEAYLEFKNQQAGSKKGLDSPVKEQMAA